MSRISENDILEIQKGLNDYVAPLLFLSSTPTLHPHSQSALLILRRLRPSVLSCPHSSVCSGVQLASANKQGKNIEWAGVCVTHTYTHTHQDVFLYMWKPVLGIVLLFYFIFFFW